MWWHRPRLLLLALHEIQWLIDLLFDTEFDAEYSTVELKER